MMNRWIAPACALLASSTCLSAQEHSTNSSDARRAPNEGLSPIARVAHITRLNDLVDRLREESLTAEELSNELTKLRDGVDKWRKTARGGVFVLQTPPNGPGRELGESPGKALTLIRSSKGPETSGLDGATLEYLLNSKGAVRASPPTSAQPGRNADVRSSRAAIVLKHPDGSPTRAKPRAPAAPKPARKTARTPTAELVDQVAALQAEMGEIRALLRELREHAAKTRPVR